MNCDGKVLQQKERQNFNKIPSKKNARVSKIVPRLFCASALSVRASASSLSAIVAASAGVQTSLVRPLDWSLTPCSRLDQGRSLVLCYKHQQTIQTEFESLTFCAFLGVPKAIQPSPTTTKTNNSPLSAAETPQFQHAVTSP
jgi:hypothetical protein